MPLTTTFGYRGLMLPEIEYLSFAQRWFGRVRYDLASSGAPTISASELGVAAVDDPRARQSFVESVAGRYGCEVGAVAPAIGASGALWLIFACLKRGSVVVETPGYEPFRRVPVGFGHDVSRRDRHQLLDLSSSPNAVVLSNPHNPSGHVFSDEELVSLANRIFPGWLIVDEAYRELRLPGTTAFGLASNIVTCSSATKCLGVPWARAGWVLVPEALRERAARAEHHHCGMLPPSGLAYGALALNQADRLLQRVRDLGEGKRELVASFLAASSHLEASESSGDLFVWVRDRAERNLLPLIERGVTEHSTIVSPGSFFGHASHFRLSWTAPKSDLEEGLKRLEQVLAPA